jgi:hypothetical protein
VAWVGNYSPTAGRGAPTGLLGNFAGSGIGGAVLMIVVGLMKQALAGKSAAS